MEDDNYTVFHLENSNDKKIVEFKFEKMYLLGIKIMHREFSTPKEPWYSIINVKMARGA